MSINIARRRKRIRARIKGTTERPRLAVHISNRHITAQVINDETGKTLAYVSTVSKPVKGAMSEKATWVGTEIAKRTKQAKFTKVVFDRGGRIYHGRVKLVAEAARKGGLEF